MKRILIAMLMLACVSLWGCGGGQGGGKLTLKGSQRGGADGPIHLAGDFRHATYSADGKNNITLVLVEGDIEQPTQAVVIRLFWMPRAGLTPIDSNATNASVHYIIFSSDAAGDANGRSKVGVYAGAGFVYPYDNPGKGGMDVGVWQTTLRLADASDGFADLLGLAQLKGKFRAQRDDAATQATIDRLGQRITAALGYPRLVSAD